MSGKVIKREFQKTDLTSNNNKRWGFDATDNGDGTLTVAFRWGRVGGTGQTKTLVLSERELEKKVSSQVNKDGYVELDLHNAAAPAVVTKSGPAVTGPVAPYIENIFAAARENIKSYLTISTDALSAAQINLGRSQLNAISDLYGKWQSSKSRNVGADLKSAVQLYYNYIPTKLPHRIDAESVVLDLCKDFALQEDRLNQLEAAIQSQTVVVSGTQEINLGAELSILSPSDPTYARLIKYIKDSDRGHVRINVRAILEARLPLERSAYENCEQGKSRVWELFHGTNAEYVRHILGTKTKQGLIIPRHAANGRAFGDGIYFANISTKSAQYASEYNGLAYMFVANVKVGNPYVPNAGSSSLKPPAGYDSVHAVGGRTHKMGGYMAHDEIIVYNTSQQSIFYLVVMGR